MSLKHIIVKIQSSSFKSLIEKGKMEIDSRPRDK